MDISLTSESASTCRSPRHASSSERSAALLLEQDVLPLSAREVENDFARKKKVPTFVAALAANRLPEIDASKHALSWKASAHRLVKISGTIIRGLVYLWPLALLVRKIEAPKGDAPEILVPRQTDHRERLGNIAHAPTPSELTLANYQKAQAVIERPQGIRPYTQAAFFRDHPFTAIFGAGFMGMYQHLGAVRAAIDVGLRPDSMAGASAGAIVAAMMGCLPLQDVEDALLSLSLLDFMDVKLKTVLHEGALCSGEAFVRKLERTFAPSGVTKIEECRPPLKVASFEAGRTVLHAQGNLVEAVRFSAGLPVLFAREKGMEGGWIDEHLSLATEPGKAALIFRLSEGEPASYFERKLGRPDPLYNVPEDPMHRTLYAKVPSRLNFVNFWTHTDFRKSKLKSAVDEAYSAAMSFFASPGN